MTTKRLMLAIGMLALTVLTACNGGLQEGPTEAPPATATYSPAAEPTATSASAGESEHRCGDDVCDGPENADNCPEDCGSDAAESAPTTVPESASVPPVYVTVAGHIEDVPVYTNCDVYPDYREKLLLFAETIAPSGVAFNLQIEYEFFVGASECETEALRATTDGQNVIDYLATHYGFEIDPHQEGGWDEGEDNYADIRFLGGTVAPSISENVGGLVWDAPEQFARLAAGETGKIYNDFTWRPEILSLAVSHSHHLGDFSDDDVTSGVWIPQGTNQDFWVHDPDGRMVYVAPGEHANWDADRPWLSTPDFVEAVANDLERGLIDRDKMYTASIAVPQSVIFHPERYEEMLALLDQLAPMIESGQAAYVTYSEAVEIWRTEYDAQPNIFFREGVQRPSGAEDAP